MDFLSCHEYRLESYAFFPNVPLVYRLRALPNRTNRHKVFFGKAILVAFQNDPERIYLKRDIGHLSQLGGFVIAIVVSILE
jgi:hypothetical protein